MEQEKTKFRQIDRVLQEAGYHATKSIGKGAFGQVLVANKDGDSLLYAIKVMNKLMIKKKPFLKKYITQEVTIMKKLVHPNIVRLYDSFQTNDFIVLVMEYCKQGNLLTYQAGLDGRAFQINHAVHVIIQVLTGLKYIHQNGFIHRDIKSQNILIKCQLVDQNRYSLIHKIADFGFARPIGKIGARTQCGTQKYMAPQILGCQPYNISVDLWAIGVLFYFMLFTEYPFQGHDMKADIKRKCQSGFNINAVINKKQRLSNIPEQIKDLFCKIFVIDFKKRIKFCEILNHPVFQPYRSNYPQLNNYQKIYYSIEKKQVYMKDEIEQIQQFQHESEAQPQDQTRAVLLQKVKQYMGQNTSHIRKYLQQLNFEIKKVLYLQQCAMEMYQNYSSYLTYAQRLGSKFYLLRAFIFFCEPLLKRLQSRQMPEGFNQIQISQNQWIECTNTEQYRKMLAKLQEQYLKNICAYEDTYNLIQNIIHQMPINGFQKGYRLEITEKDYNEFKFGYRSVTVHLFKVIQDCKNIDTHLQNKIKMRIFCCHMIKRVFNRANLDKNFPYFKQWMVRKKIRYDYSFDFNYFKRWILEENSTNLAQNIQILHKNL